MSAMEFHKWVVHDALQNVAFGKRSQDMSLCGAHVFFVPIETKMTVPLLVFYFWALVVFFSSFCGLFDPCSWCIHAYIYTCISTVVL